ncbi:MAG TPA: HEPN domain-containing protein [Ignavibacteria bacterium]|nr:HEPN domain-containing protein [Ignavibacteria bacterium]
MYDKKIKYWVEISEDDLETSEILFEKNKLLFSGYLLQQSIEKILKAYYQQKLNAFPPKTHNLVYLSEVCGLFDELNEVQENLLYQLNPLNLETRYPEYRVKISKSLTKERLAEILKHTKEFQRWIKLKL